MYNLQNTQEAVNPSQQKNLQLLEEVLDREAIMDKSKEEEDQLGLVARLKISSNKLPLRDESRTW